MTQRRIVFPVLAAISFAAVAFVARPQAIVTQTAPAPALRTAATETPVDLLYRDVERAQALRAVKYLQVTYQQYAQYGMWSEMASLFAANAEATFGAESARGRDAIGRFLLTKYGNGREGLPAGGIHNQILVSPVVTLAYDGKSARARWSEITMLGRFKGQAAWSGGVEENDYVLEDGRWKIARLRYYEQFAGPYETGWRSLTPTIPVIPFHYTPATAGRPVPDQPGDILKTASPLTLAEIEDAIRAMGDEDAVRNLQNIYGYYIDRKMWDDVTDLFAPDGVLEIAGVGTFAGVKNIRRALERDGPAGLQTGQVNDHLQLATTVTVEPGGAEARARGLDLGMLTPKLGDASWSVATFLNRYAKINGIWQIREMRIFPRMKADYYQGWGKSGDPTIDTLAIPEFFQPNPATGKPVAYPAGMRAVGARRLVAGSAPAAPAATPPAASAVTTARISAARRQLDVAKAYDAVENVTNALGYYMDEMQWQEWADTMSENGWRIQGSGWYIGRDRLYRVMTQGHTSPPSPSNPRDDIRPHLKPQPVIHVSPDGRSAKLRNRLWLFFANSESAGAFDSGMYPNDTAVLEDGVWKIDVNMVDQKYFSSPSYAQGWARPVVPAAAPGGARSGAPPRQGGAGRGGGRGVTVLNSGIEFPPDIPTSLMDGYRRKNFGSVNYPNIKPMWFHYRNPVSGRTPPNYCPDVKTCSSK